MRFLADMGVSQRVVTWLQEQGHDAIHLRDEGLQKLENGNIFTKAFRESRIILTWDLDFTSVAERSFSLLDHVQMFVKPMPQLRLRSSW